jgi:transcriptional regulator with XRE-family HTH domain
MADVKPEANSRNPLMPGFLSELAAFCRAEHGRVSRLAEDLGIAQPHVSAWLTGKQAPSGEYTLQIQGWLARQGGSSAGSRRAGRPPHPRETTSTSQDEQAPRAEEIPVWLL